MVLLAGYLLEGVKCMGGDEPKAAQCRISRVFNQQVLLAGYLMEGPIRLTSNQYKRAVSAYFIGFSSNAVYLMGI